ncbi:MAG TPA: NADH-quinone oxidoreductase subunit NuoE [Bacteroidetes bacterium]|nr:NADH-quinone oxidoreductase subunit NuoE [Bacteroidota bacterium]
MTQKKTFVEIPEEHPPEESSLIPLLQKAQHEDGYISPVKVEEIAQFLKITESQIYGVASFYSQFRFTAPGKHSISVCLGTACHVSGGETLLNTIERNLEVSPGECTPDGKFDLNRVACLGCCALAPVIKVDDEIYSNVNVIKLNDILDLYE